MLEAMKLDTDQTFSQFLKKELGLKGITNKEFILTKRHYSNVSLYSEDPSQNYYRNDKFVIGLELQENELNSVLRILSLLYKDASTHEALLLVRAIVTFCHKKGITISKGRPKGESRVVTAPADVY